LNKGLLLAPARKLPSSERVARTEPERVESCVLQVSRSSVDGGAGYTACDGNRRDSRDHPGDPHRARGREGPRAHGGRAGRRGRSARGRRLRRLRARALTWASSRSSLPERQLAVMRRLSLIATALLAILTGLVWSGALTWVDRYGVHHLMPWAHFGPHHLIDI